MRDSHKPNMRKQQCNTSCCKQTMPYRAMAGRATRWREEASERKHVEECDGLMCSDVLPGSKRASNF